MTSIITSDGQLMVFRTRPIGGAPGAVTLLVRVAPIAVSPRKTRRPQVERGFA
ncbi:hypothetical protein [Halovulum marinum]|uniref:hypothetical protein n=1 Tax=Halovulum marinum TaxID=2662447 RepID=UPI0012B3B921|nr:hypothetical protein [Halovulum marinum]